MRWISQQAGPAYTGDIKLPRMIHGKILRSPHAHARIRSIDTSRAEALPGVLAVVTWRDLWPAKDIANQEKVKTKDSQFRDSYFARHKALYCGHPIAAVAAAEPWLAEEALKLIDVDYEVLPAVLDPLRAMEEGSPILHEGVVRKELAGMGTNVAFRVDHLKGNPDEGFAQADVVIEREFRISTVHQGYIEPMAAVAAWTSERQLKLWSIHPGCLFCAPGRGRSIAYPSGPHPGYSHGNRRFFRWEERRFSGTGRGFVVQEIRTAGQDRHDPGGSLHGHGPLYRLLHPGEDGSHAPGPDYCGHRLYGIRNGGLPRAQLGSRRGQVYVRPLRYPQRPHRRF